MDGKQSQTGRRILKVALFLLREQLVSSDSSVLFPFLE
ncbi:hypothetical protein V6x_54790 [Gimesia chilikensis]|uniref:Uncharacterized protein n=1 Tax=Gimesia chilikensis TaxID=2605989 RepID=A0A517WKF2_9PLAN|nr:hypothetical protein V6x_54790 [Gimesia chilikensis]